MKLFTTASLLFFVYAGYSSVPTIGIDSSHTCISFKDTVLKREYYTYTDVAPGYPGGMEQLYLFIRKNLNYHETETVVYVTFLVETNGSVTFVNFARPIDDYKLRTEIIRIIQLMPKWKPAMCDGKNVTCLYKLPIRIEHK